MKQKPHVLYRFFDKDDALLYVGITNSPHRRFNNHRSDKYWFKHVVRSTMEHFATRTELEAAEVRAIHEEKPRYNLAHSVASPPDVIGAAKPQARYTPSDASRFPAPDAIASEPREAEHEARLDELEKLAARQLIPRTPCPTCDYILLTREYDGLIKCLNCLSMWAPEELPADFEAFLQQLEETR